MATPRGSLKRFALIAALAVFISLAYPSARADQPRRLNPHQGVTPQTAPLRSIDVPSDAQSNCRLSPDAFAKWFKTHRVAPGGTVTPSNGLTFPAQPSECDYYEWALRTFLWATSPAPWYSANARIFGSSTFYDVSLSGSQGHGTLIPHVRGHIVTMALRAAKPDEHGLQIVFSRSGQPLDVQTAPLGPHNLPLVVNGSGEQVEIGNATLGSTGIPVFHDRTGNVVTSPRPVLAPNPAQNRTSVEKITVNGLTVYMDGSGNSVPVATGDTSGAVLESQKGSLVYYAIMVNDVYAYFLTGQQNKELLATQFPTSQGELNDITKLATKHHAKLANPLALAIELKSAWVDASTLANPGDFITTTATIPNYDRSNQKKWVLRGTKTATLALVGMHVVGSVRGHPDMVWSTFEHVSNAPNGRYSYTSTKGDKTVTPDTKGNWVFCCTHSDGPFDQQHMSQQGSDIAANDPFDISPSDTLRWKAWGISSDAANAASSNAQVISLNSAVMKQLNADDIRRKYVLIGAMWTTNANSPGLRNVGGAQALANATLETYFQGSSTKSLGSFPCFGCHVATNTDLLQMSHIYPVTAPLWGKPIAGTPNSRTFEPSKSLTKVAWTTSPYQYCLGVTDYYFSDAAKQLGGAFTTFFPVQGIQTSVQPKGSLSQSGLFAGLEYAAMRPAGCQYYNASLQANGATLFDLTPLRKHSIISAKLTLTGKRTLTYAGQYGAHGGMGVSKGGFCQVSVAPAKNQWWRASGDKLHFQTGGFLVYTGYPSGYGGSGYGSSSGKKPALSIDVTKVVSDWATHDFSNNDGFVVESAVNGPRASFYSTACVTEFAPTLQVVYF
jgi:hypothetical protein